MPPTSLRFAWLIAGDEVYGVRQAIVNLALEVRAIGGAVRMISLGPGAFADECRQLGLPVEVLGVGPPRGLRAGLKAKLLGLARMASVQRRCARAVEDSLRREPADVLHFLWPSLVYIGGSAAHARGIPAFWEMPNIVGGGYPLQLNRRLYQVLCAKYGIQPLADSAYTAGTLGEDRVKPIVFYHVADSTRFDPERVTPVDRADIGVPADAVMITIVARLHPEKGQLRVFRAMMRDPELRRQNLHLVLLGGPTDGEVASQLREEARAAGAEDRLHLIGNVSDPERYFASCDFAINSRIDPEPFGLTVIEAMMMGKPVLVHALGGPAETVLDGQTGWHIHTPTEEAFAAGIRRALEDRPRWPDMCRAARRHALANFTKRIVAERYIDIARRQIDERSSRRSVPPPQAAAS
jgi:glycosyltransferase involved in cell wall biosynthesis